MAVSSQCVNGYLGGGWGGWGCGLARVVQTRRAHAAQAKAAAGENFWPFLQGETDMPWDDMKQNLDNGVTLPNLEDVIIPNLDVT